MDTIGAEVTLHGISYVAGTKNNRKVILKDISCRYPSGLNAILGPSGSGKTTLLDIITNRKDPKGQEGTVLVDGKLRPDNFRESIGYVIQDDLVYGTLTVKENIAFSANLRLRTKMTRKAKEKLVDRTLRELGLLQCADTKVGTVYIRGVSGGERKRTNIGMELVIARKVLFLDEPTSGLDASMAVSLLLTLKALSDNGHTIILTIHQPRYAIFKLFDQITLLSLGRLVYHGPANRSLQYFENIGFQCEKYNNPADFFLDIINADSTAVQNALAQDYSAEPSTKVDLNAAGNISDIELGTSNQYALENQVRNVTFAEKLENQFKSSQTYNSQKEELEHVFDDFTHKHEVKQSDVPNHTSFALQVKFICKRILLHTFRNPGTYITQIGLVLVLSFSTGGIYFQLDETIANGIPNRAGGIFFIIMTLIFLNNSALVVFIRERDVFVHEQSAGYYGCFAYFLSKVLCDVIPMRLQPVVLLSFITYFMIGFQLDATRFCCYLFTLFLTSVGAASVVFAFSTSIKLFAMANLLVSSIFLLMIVFSGFLVKISTVGWWLKWLAYISLIRYSSTALLINEMENMTFCRSYNETTYCNSQAGNDFLHFMEIDYGTSWDFWKNHLALVIISLILLFLSYIQLRNLRKTT